MALASYLRALAVASRLPEPEAGLDSDWIPVLIERLSATAVAPGAWGLGVSWYEQDASEPYAITTARCVLSLIAAGRAGHERALPLAREGADWLAERLPWTELPSGERAPAYSPTLPFALPNIAAQVAAALAEASAATAERRHEKQLSEARSAVLSWQLPNGWWPYAPGEAPLVRGRRGDLRLDLVHSAYVLEGLILAAGGSRLADDVETRLSAAVDAGFGVFADLECANGAWSEGIRARRAPPKAGGDRDPPRAIHVPPRGWWVQAKSETRPWGYGAALVALSLRGLQGPRLRTATAMLTQVEQAMPEQGVPLTWGASAGEVRHAAHVAEGLAFVAAAQGSTPKS